MRMRFCHFGIKFDRASKKPSGSYIQIATTCTRVPVNLWKCNCGTAGKPAIAINEHELDWYGHNALRAEWRNKTLATLTARLIDQIDKHRSPRHEKSVVHLSVHTRTDKGVKTYVQSPKNGPQWDHVVRRVTTNLDNNSVIQDINVKDQPIGYNYTAPLPSGISHISTRLYWESPTPSTYEQWKHCGATPQEGNDYRR